MDHLTGQPAFTVLPTQRTPVKPMAAIMKDHFLPDMGRMSG